jgi:hypothetical protein
MTSDQRSNPVLHRRHVLAGLLSSAVLPASGGIAAAQTATRMLDPGARTLTTALALPVGVDWRGQISTELRPAAGFVDLALVIMPRGTAPVAMPYGQDSDNQGLVFLDNIRVAGNGGYSAQGGFRAATMDGLSFGDAVNKPNYAAPFILSRIRFYGLRTAIDLRVALESHIRDCFFRACDTGIRLGVGPQTMPVNAITVARCHFRKCRAGITAGDTRWNLVRVTDSTFEGNLGPALSLRRADFDAGRVALTAQGCWFEQNNGTDWDIEADFDGPLIFRDCSLALTSTRYRIPWVGRYDFGRCDTVFEGGSIVANGAPKALIRSRGRLTFRDASIRMRGRRLRHVGMDLGGANPAASVIYDNCRLEMVSHLTPTNPQIAPTEFRGFTRFDGMTGKAEQRAAGSAFQLSERRPARIVNRAPDPGFRADQGAWRASTIDPPAISRIPFGGGTNALTIDWRGGVASDDARHSLALLQGMGVNPGEYIAVSLGLAASQPQRRVRMTLVDTATGVALCKAQTFAGGDPGHVLLVGRNDGLAPASVSLVLSAADTDRGGYTLRIMAPQCSIGPLAAIQPVLRGGINIDAAG